MGILSFTAFAIVMIAITIATIKYVRGKKSRQLKKWLDSNADSFNTITYMQKSINEEDFKAIDYIMLPPMVVRTIGTQGNIYINKDEKIIRLYTKSHVYKIPMHLSDLLCKLRGIIDSNSAIAIKLSDIYVSKYSLKEYLDAVNHVFKGRSIFLYN